MKSLFGREVFCFQNLSNEGLWVVEQAPPLFSQKSLFETRYHSKTHATLFFGLRHFLPRLSVDLPFIYIATPKKFHSESFNLVTNRIQKPKTFHDIGGNGLDHC